MQENSIEHRARERHGRDASHGERADDTRDDGLSCDEVPSSLSCNFVLPMLLGKSRSTAIIITVTVVVAVIGIVIVVTIMVIVVVAIAIVAVVAITISCLLYTSPSPRDLSTSRMPSSA